MTPFEEWQQLLEEEKVLKANFRELARSMGADVSEEDGSIINDEGLSAQDYRALAKAQGKIVAILYREDLLFELSDQPEEGN